MPRRDGTGPGGKGQGGGQGSGRKTMSGTAMGAGGNCLCPKCGHKIPHSRGVPCMSLECPKCGTSMVRE